MKGTIDAGRVRRPGDRDAVLSGSFRDHAAGIYRFVYAKVGNRAVAEDLTGHVFLKAVRWLGDGYSSESIRSWLYATARTALIDYWREQGQRRTVPLDDSMGLLFVGGDEERELAGTRERARRILAALPPRDGMVLRLRFLHGYTAPEIGRALGIEPGNVRVIQQRALRRAAALAVSDGEGRAGTPREASTSTVR